MDILKLGKACMASKRQPYWHSNIWNFSILCTCCLSNYTALNETSNQQAKPTENTIKSCRQLMDYLYTHPKAVNHFNASEMILSLVSDAAYLVLHDVRSRCATLYTLTDIFTSEPPTIKSNGPVYVLVKTICGIPASASEAETAGIFLGAQETVPMLNTLVESGHPQPSCGTPIKTDNSTAHDILTSQVWMKHSKSFGMPYHWVKDRIAQGQFNFSGLVANITVWTTTINTIHRHIICWCACSTFTPTVYLTCEGVLVCTYPTHCRPWLHVITHHGIFSPVKT